MESIKGIIMNKENSLRSERKDPDPKMENKHPQTNHNPIDIDTELSSIATQITSVNSSQWEDCLEIQTRECWSPCTMIPDDVIDKYLKKTDQSVDSIRATKVQELQESFRNLRFQIVTPSGNEMSESCTPSDQEDCWSRIGQDGDSQKQDSLDSQAQEDDVVGVDSGSVRSVVQEPPEAETPEPEPKELEVEEVEVVEESYGQKLRENYPGIAPELLNSFEKLRISLSTLIPNPNSQFDLTSLIGKYISEESEGTLDNDADNGRVLTFKGGALLYETDKCHPKHGRKSNVREESMTRNEFESLLKLSVLPQVSEMPAEPHALTESPPRPQEHLVTEHPLGITFLEKEVSIPTENRTTKKRNMRQTDFEASKCWNDPMLMLKRFKQARMECSTDLDLD